MDARWLNEDLAMQRAGRARVTLREWRRTGEVTATVQGPRRIMYLVPSLDRCAQVRRERYEHRPLPGRPRNVA